MKQLVLILCMAFAAPYAWGQGYVITGEVKGAEGQTVSLKQFRDLQPAEVNVATVTSGKFTLKGAAPYPEFCLLYVGDRGAAPFFVENSNIRIVVDMENMEKSKVSGSKENDIFMEFMGGIEKYAQQQKQLNDSYAALSSLSVAAPDAISNIQAQMEKLNADRIAHMVHYVQKHPGKISTAFIVNMYLMRVLDMSQIEQVAGGFDAKTDPSPWVKMLKDHVASLKRTDIGQPFPDITLKNPDDHPVSLSDYAGKGKYVLIDFWASWCGPCRNANPQVVALYQRYKNKGFEIVGISLDRGKKEWVDAIESDHLVWPHMSDLNYWQSAAAKLYSVSSIPYTVLLDKNGKIIAKGLRVGELRAKLAELLD
jgi:thiol-disulfide isomerase/thioredoxin